MRERKQRGEKRREGRKKTIIEMSGGNLNTLKLPNSLNIPFLVVFFCGAILIIFGYGLRICCHLYSFIPITFILHDF